MIFCGFDSFVMAQSFKDWAATFQPSSVAAEVILGWGNLRLRILGAEVSLSDAMPGVQVCFELGEIHIEQAKRIVQEMCESNLNKNHAMNGTARER